MSANEISLFNSSVSTVDGNASINNDMENEDVILARLNELRLWQESQRKSLVESQLDQQKMLELEKHKLYALFGLSADESSLQDAGADSTESSFGTHNNQHQQQQQLKMINSVEETPKTNQNHCNPSVEQKSIELKSPSINQLHKIIENLANRSPKRDVQNNHTENTADIPKRPYLKRGEGLKNRFKISPDTFRLDNLPKYKYARRMQKHAQSQKSRKQRHHQEIPTNDTITSTADVGVASTSEGQQNNVKDDGVQNRSQCDDNRKVKETTKRPSPQTLQLKLKSNPTANISKPLSSNDVLHQYKQDVPTSVEQSILTRRRPNLLSPATKNLLDTPTRERVQFQQDEINELKHFVQLEQDLNQNNSVLEMDRGRRDDNVVLKFKVGLNLSPKHYMGHRNFGDIEEEEEEEEEHFRHSISSDSSVGDESKHVRFHSRALAIEKDNRSQVMAESIYDVPRTSSPNEKSTDSFQKFKEKLFDRRLKQKFQNRLSVAKDFEISDLNSNKSDCDDEEGIAIQLNETNGTELKSKLQERMQSLEKEIHSFREQNNELTKLIREYDMIRLTYDEEHRAAQERMENERINFEMYMHDQHLKLLDEKSKWEKKMKEGRAITQTEKDELARLREKCASHEAELIAREQKHVNAQSRIRAQLRNVEKDLKETRIELESLQRENKKLETENMRLRRQSNSKILNEINKSISKLAHSNEHDNQLENEKDGVNEKPVRRGVKKCSNMNAHKTVVAKVTSHREPLKGNRERSNSVPNLRSEITDKYSYELCSSPNASEGENSAGSSQPDDKSNYFPNSANKERVISAREEEIDKVVSSQCDETENINMTMKRIIENPDGSKDVWYQNGNLKKISADGMSIRMLYFNKDIKETDIKEGIVKYYYAETNTWQTTYLDGLEIFEYPDGQTEHRYKDGKVEIYFPSGTVRITNPAREQQEGIKEEWKYTDGSNAIQMTSGERILLLPNGQREVHANGHKRREYPDGTVKIVYPDGSQETRYSNGRVRLKNKDGKLIMDSETISI